MSSPQIDPVLLSIIKRVVPQQLAWDVLGLGPPVCTKCNVLAHIDPIKKDWYCPICGDDPKGFAAYSDNAHLEELRGNERFLRFTYGMDDDQIRLGDGTIIKKSDR